MYCYCFCFSIINSIFFGTPTIVQQPSMFPTLKPNQRLILNRWARTIKEMPSRGDIITFEAPTSDSYTYDANDVRAKYSNNPTSAWGKFVYYVLESNKISYIKRVIALPGEHLQIMDGKVYINGEELEEKYLQPDVTTSIENCPFYDLIVPENCVFVMGDNRPKSTDSRKFGCIPLEKLRAKCGLDFGH